MIRNRNLIHYLLVICILSMPVFGAVSAETLLTDHASMGCVDCSAGEPAIEPACKNDHCVPAAHACGVYYCAGFIPENPFRVPGREFETAGFVPGASAFGSYLAESIYRPPIS